MLSFILDEEEAEGGLNFQTTVEIFWDSSSLRPLDA